MKQTPSRLAPIGSKTRSPAGYDAALLVLAARYRQRARRAASAAQSSPKRLPGSTMKASHQ